MKKSKILTTLAAGAMAVSPASNLASALQVSAEETNSPATTEQETVKDKVQVALEEHVEEAQESVDEAQSKVDEQEPVVEEAKTVYDGAQSVQADAHTNFETASNAVNSYVSNEIKVNQEAVDNAQKELDALKSEKERLEQEAADLATQKEALTNEYNEAKAKYDELTSSTSVEELEGQITAEQTKLAEAQATLKTAEDNLASVTTAYNDAVAATQTAQDAVDTQQSTVTGLANQLAAKEAQVTSLQTSVVDAQTAYDQAIDETTKAQLEATLEQAKSDLVGAQDEYNAYAEYLATAKTELETLQADVTAAQDAAKPYETAYNEAKDAYDNAVSEVETLNNTIATLSNSKYEFTQKVVTYEQAVTEAQSKLDALTGDESSAKTLYETTKAAYEAVLAQWNQGSLGFFAQNGDQQAQDIIAEGETLGSTKVGDYAEEDGFNTEYDATYLENMKICVDLLTETNRLRALEGLSALTVNDTLMAIAQVKANASYKLEKEGNLAHTGYYSVGENLASGYSVHFSTHFNDTGEKVEGVGPYCAWYGLEKKAYEEYCADEETYPGLKDMNLYQIQENYPDLFYKVGHYLNMKLNYPSQGLGFVKYQGFYEKQSETYINDANGLFALELGTHNTEAPSATTTGKSYDLTANLISVEDYQEKFNTYYNNLKSDLATKKAAYLEAKTAYENGGADTDVIAKAEAELAAAKANLESAQKTLSQITSELAEAEEKLPSSVAKIDTTKEAEEETENAYANAQSAIAHAQEKVDEKQGEVDYYQNEVDTREASLNVAKAEKEKAQAAVDNYETNVANLLEALENAKSDLASTKKDVETLTSEKLSAESELESLNTKLSGAKATEETAKNSYDKAKSTKDDAQDVVDGINSTIKELSGKKSTIISSKETMETTTAALEKVESNIASNKAATAKVTSDMEPIGTELTKVSEEKGRLANVMSQYHSLVDGIMAVSNVELTEDESTLFEALQEAILALEDAQTALDEAESNYSVEKAKYDELISKLNEAKANLAKAQAALDAYLNPEPTPDTGTDADTSKTDSKTETSKTDTVITTNTSQAKEGTDDVVVTSSATSSSEDVNTGIDLHSEIYLTTLAVAGIGYLVIKKKEKEE